MRQSLNTRKGRFVFVLCAAVVVVFVCPSSHVRAQKVDRAKLETAARRAGKAAKVIADLSALPPAETIPKELMEKARAVAVFPDTDKVNMLTMKFWKGFGLVSRRVEGGWSTPAFYAFAVSDIGWTRVKSDEPGIIMLFMNDEIFEKDRVKLEGSEGPVGEWTPEKERNVKGAGIILYSLSEGRLRGISVEDDNSTQAGVNSDNNVNKAVYGLKAREVLSGKTPAGPPVPPEVTNFQTALANLWK